MLIASREYVIKKMTELMLTPKKKFSQNFLTDYQTVQEAITALEILPDEQVIEIGPGLGALTQELENQKAKTDAYEIDGDMVNHLQKVFINSAYIHVYHEDFLKIDLHKYQNQTISFVSNIPYNITSPVIEKIVTSQLKIKHFEFMVQKEVYGRIRATKGSKDYGPLNIFIEYVGKLKVIKKVPAKNFIPIPNVDSIILMIDFNKEINSNCEFNQRFVKLTKACFLMRRKTLLNNLISYCHDKQKAIDIIQKAKLDEKIRPDQMSLEDYLNLTKATY